MTDELTVIIEPQTKVIKGLITFSGCESSSRLKRSLNTEGISPTNTMTGINTMALRRLLYHDRERALPFTMLRLFLITTEWTEAMAELATPKPTPIKDMGVPSRKTPTTKPTVTSEQAKRMRKEGRECSKI